MLPRAESDWSSLCASSDARRKVCSPTSTRAFCKVDRSRRVAVLEPAVLCPEQVVNRQQVESLVRVARKVALVACLELAPSLPTTGQSEPAALPEMAALVVVRMRALTPDVRPAGHSAAVSALARWRGSALPARERAAQASRAVYRVQAAPTAAQAETMEGQGEFQVAAQGEIGTWAAPMAVEGSKRTADQPARNWRLAMPMHYQRHGGARSTGSNSASNRSAPLSLPALVAQPT
jgi:hypothetical protein